MSKLTVGSIVRPTAGKEAGKYYVILSAEDEYVYLSDGRRRKAELPKKKKLKHVAASGFADEYILQKLAHGSKVTNKEVRRAISDYLKRIDNN